MTAFDKATYRENRERGLRGQGPTARTSRVRLVAFRLNRALRRSGLSKKGRPGARPKMPTYRRGFLYREAPGR